MGCLAVCGDRGPFDLKHWVSRTLCHAIQPGCSDLRLDWGPRSDFNPRLGA